VCASDGGRAEQEEVDKTWEELVSGETALLGKKRSSPKGRGIGQSGILGGLSQPTLPLN